MTMILKVNYVNNIIIIYLPNPQN